MKRSALVFPGVAVVLAAAVAALAGPLDAPAARAQPAPEPQSSSAFEADFATSEDFYGRFDYGYSGISPFEWNGGGNNGAITAFHGDHNDQCEAPTTSREVAFQEQADQLDFSELFWHCAPGDDPTKGHLMTGVDTLGYNIAWFSPKPTFTNVREVCWDVNLTNMSHRKWTQVFFVDARPGEDATRYPAGTVTDAVSNVVARGTGGYDLGYTSPEFRQDAPNTTILPQSGTLAGLKQTGGMFGWFQEQDTWTEKFGGWTPEPIGGTDKAARFEHCLSNQPGDVVRVTQESPQGTRVIDMPGQIPQHPVRVVFQDDNYDPAKDERYDATVLTWHWDNIRVDAASATESAAPVAPLEVPTAAASPPPASSGGDVFRRTDLASEVALVGLLLGLAGLAVVAGVRRVRSGGATPGAPPPPQG